MGACTNSGRRRTKYNCAEGDDLPIYDAQIKRALEKMPCEYQQFFSPRTNRLFPSPYTERYAQWQNILHGVLYLFIALFVFFLVVFAIVYWTNPAFFGITPKIPKKAQWEAFIIGSVAIAAIGAFVIAGYGGYVVVYGQTITSFLTSYFALHRFFIVTYPWSFRLYQQIQPTNVALQKAAVPPVDDANRQAFVEIFLTAIALTGFEDYLLLTKYPDPADVRFMNHCLGSPIFREQYLATYPYYANTAVCFLNQNVLPYSHVYDDAATLEPPCQRAKEARWPFVPYTSRQARARSILGNGSFVLVAGFLLLWVVFLLVFALHVDSFLDPDDQTLFTKWVFVFELTEHAFTIAAIFMTALGIWVAYQASVSTLRLTGNTAFLEGILNGWPYSLPLAQAMDLNNKRLQTLQPPILLDPTTLTFTATQVADAVLLSITADLSAVYLPQSARTRQRVQQFRARFLVQQFHETQDTIPDYTRCYIKCWVLPYSQTLPSSRPLLLLALPPSLPPLLPVVPIASSSSSCSEAVSPSSLILP